MTTADNVLKDIRRQVNVTLWFKAVQRRLIDETDPARRVYLAEMLLELNNRLPERAAQ